MTKLHTGSEIGCVPYTYETYMTAVRDRIPKEANNLRDETTAFSCSRNLYSTLLLFEPLTSLFTKSNWGDDP